MNNKFKKIISLIAATLAVMMLSAGCADEPLSDGDVSSLNSETTETSKIAHAESYTEDTVTPDTENVTVEFEEVEKDSAIYHVYSDHAIVAFVNANKYYMVDTINGVPVTGFADDAFAQNESGNTCEYLYCYTGFDIYNTAFEYAVSHGATFIETDSAEYPDHYYPDGVKRHNWHLRDRSDDTFVAVDDHARITELVNAYLSGDKSVYDELLQRVLYRYASNNQIAYHVEGTTDFKKYVFDDECIYDELCDKDMYTIDRDDGMRYYFFAYGYIDTYDELREYIENFYVVQDWIFDDIMNVDGEAAVIRSGAYNLRYDDEIEYVLDVSADKLTLHEHQLVKYEDRFQGDDEDIEFVFVDGKWLSPYGFTDYAGNGDIQVIYERMYGTVLPPV